METSLKCARFFSERVCEIEFWYELEIQYKEAEFCLKMTIKKKTQTHTVLSKGNFCLFIML